MKEKKLELLSEEERQRRIEQQYRSQLKTIETVKTFMLMGYDRADIFEAMKSLHFIVSEDQIEFYCEFINDRKDKKTIQEINDALWRFLWEMNPPKLPVPEPKSEKQYQKEAVSSYMCRIVVLNLLVDRIDYLKSVLNAGCFEMTHFISAGYDACYVETMKKAIEKNPKKHSRDIAQQVYQELYVEAKHMAGFIYSIDKIDFWGMIHACREKWQNGRKKYEKEGK